MLWVQQLSTLDCCKNSQEVPPIVAAGCCSGVETALLGVETTPARVLGTVDGLACGTINKQNECLVGPYFSKFTFPLALTLVSALCQLAQLEKYQLFPFNKWPLAA